MQPIFDTHAHYDHRDFAPDRDALIASLPERGVDLVVNIGSNRKSSEASAALAEQYAHVYATAGVHPHDATELDDTTAEAIIRLAANPKVVAIGEIGLDYHYDYSPRDVQRAAFKRQLEIAAELKMPVVVHSREAAEDTYELLKFYRPPGIVHCFSGSAEMAEAYVKLGFYIGFTGVVTFKNARRPLSAAAAVPPDRLLLETDCPYMAPEPYRGKRCDSTMLPRTAAAIAGVKGMEVDALIRQCHENGCAVYNINL